MTTTNNKPFANWLVASDIDGTLNNKLRQLPQRNYNMIRHFVEDLGGNFTLASGRSVPSMQKHYYRLGLQDIPAVVLNGAGIYSFAQKKMLRFNPLSEASMQLICDVYDRFPTLEIQICTQDMIYLVRPFIFGKAMVNADRLPHKGCKTIDMVPREGWGKVIFMGLPHLVKRVRAYCDSRTDVQPNYMLSSVVSYEVLETGVHKGSAVLQLADMLGVPHTNTAAIGDYFNDYDMLKSVALPAVCKQAPQEMHKIAKYVSCHCNQGAVGQFLEYIIQTQTPA